MNPERRSTARPIATAGTLLAAGWLTWQVWQRVVSMGTLPPVAKLLARLLEPKAGMTAYDPGFGTGRLLRALEYQARKPGSAVGSGTLLELFGQERDPIAFCSGAAMFAAAGVDVTLALGDSLTSPAFTTGPATLRQFDRIVANPVWGQPLPNDLVTDDAYNRFADGTPSSGLADWAWIAHLRASLADGGRMAVVLGADALSRPEDRRLREAAVEAGALDAVIWCSPSVDMCRVPAFDRRIGAELASAAILVMNGVSQRPGSTLMLDAAPLVRRHGVRYQRTLDTISHLYHSRNHLPGIAATVEPAQLALRDYDLRPDIFLAR